MSPFLELKLGKDVKQTGQHNKGGKQPSWAGEVVEFQVTGATTELEITVYDYEPLKSHDLVGKATFFIDKVLRGEQKQAEVVIYYKNKEAGKVYLDFDFMGKQA